ncbi:MAG TPA: DUF503 domain-containing protein [Thermoanaerobaculia bacterium]|nr:DUF503 domain-containing protein [Thermoanaerobaculia bacterium]
MIVGVAICELHLPGSRSLKDKRRVVKSLVERIHGRFRVSSAETDYHDLLQRAEISLAVVGNNDQEVERVLDQMRDLFDQEAEAFVTLWQPQLLEVSG